MITFAKFCLMIAGLSFASWSTHAQSYSVDWDVIAGGGGTTTGGGYSLSSTIGEPAAGGTLAGGAYSVSSGFWAASSVTMAGSPGLSILLSGTNTVVIAWPATSSGWTLQQSSSLVPGSWVSVTNVVSAVDGQNQVILPSLSGAWFYRLQNP